MDLKAKEMAQKLEERLKKPKWNFIYNKEEEKLRIEDAQSGKGVTVELNGLIAKYETQKDKAIDDAIYYIENTLNAMSKPQGLKGQENNVFPVIRSASFPVETKDGKTLVFNDHTAETRVFYALDLKQSYRLIDQSFMEKEGLTISALHEMALFNLRSLPTEWKKDQVADNAFYFINYNDGYDASRILNQSLIDKMADMVEGELAIAVPHQDVLIFADLKNKRGYDILGQMAMGFYMNGNIPITPLPFLWENHRLRPIFILAKKKPMNEEDQ
ncbi:MAG: DUF1444 family protein [Tuberibacillus sp.]